MGLAAALLGSQRIIVDNQSARARDIWLGVTAQTLASNPASDDLPTLAWTITVHLSKSGLGWTTTSPPVLGLSTTNLPAGPKP
jgi:hypothetical protein